MLLIDLFIFQPGLKLGTLKTEWLAPSLIGSHTYSSHIESTRWLNVIRKSRERLSVSTVSSEKEGDMLTELSITDVSLEENMTPEHESSGAARSSGDYSDLSLEGLDPSLDADNHFSYAQQCRKRMTSRLSKSQSDTRLMTVAEYSRILLPKKEETLNEAFLEQDDTSPVPRPPGLSDTQRTSRKENVAKPLNAVREKRLHSRSKSGSELNCSNSSPTKNPVR